MKIREALIKRIVEYRYYMGRAGWWMGTPMQVFQVIGIAKLLRLDEILNLNIWVMTIGLVLIMLIVGKIDVAIGVAKEEASYNQQFVQRPTGPIAEIQRELKEIKEDINGKYKKL